MKTEYTFHIDAFTPETLPLDRLAQYMSALADLIGYKPNVHFERLEFGSACIVSSVEYQTAPKVEQRLNGLVAKDVKAAFSTLDDMLASDNAVGKLLNNEGAVVIPFPGRNRPKPLNFPIIKQDGSIDGQIVRIGGTDASAHVTLQDGKITYTGINLSRELARNLASQLYGQKIRLFGIGRWARLPSGAWKLESFSVDRHELLDDTPLTETLDQVRAISPELMEPQIYRDLMSLRNGDEEVH
jgi:hypothetical protein